MSAHRLYLHAADRLAVVDEVHGYDSDGKVNVRIGNESLHVDAADLRVDRRLPLTARIVGAACTTTALAIFTYLGALDRRRDKAMAE